MQIDVEKLNLSLEMHRKLLALQNLPETERYIRLSKIFQDAEKFQMRKPTSFFLSENQESEIKRNTPIEIGLISNC